MWSGHSDSLPHRFAQRDGASSLYSQEGLIKYLKASNLMVIIIIKEFPDRFSITSQNLFDLIVDWFETLNQIILGGTPLIRLRS